MTKLEECEAALRKVLLDVYGIGLTGNGLFASRAVLMALREPDGIMEFAVEDVLDEGGAGYPDRIWPTMIDAVLDNKD